MAKLLIGEERKKPFANFLERYYRLAEELCEELELCSDVCEAAKVFLKSFYDYGSCSRKPSGVAGASIVLACEKLGIRLPKRRVAIASVLIFAEAIAFVLTGLASLI